MTSTLSYFSIPGMISVSKLSTTDPIFWAVSQYTGISRETIAGKERHRETVFARHLVCYFCRKRTNMSLKNIGLELGGRDHTTIIHAYNTIKGFVEIGDLQTCEAIMDIEARLMYLKPNLQPKPVLATHVPK
jgi:chromosomal replication initiator protein